MDQMFYEPQSSLFPELKGVVAQAVLSTGEGRARFRERCTALFTNIFPGLTNRVEQLHARIEPELKRLGVPREEHDLAVAALQQRIRFRMAHLRKQLFAPEPTLMLCKPGEDMAVTNWLGTVEHGNVRMAPSRTGNEKAHLASAKEPYGGESRPDLLLARLEPGEKEAAGNWETRLLLPKGAYRFSTRVMCDQPIFRGPDCPVSLKVWGGMDQQFESNRADPQHLDLVQIFAIQSTEPEEILIQCQAQSKEISLGFQWGPFVLTWLEAN
jgi:hypothetical protein